MTLSLGRLAACAVVSERIEYVLCVLTFLDDMKLSLNFGFVETVQLS